MVYYFSWFRFCADTHKYVGSNPVMEVSEAIFTSNVMPFWEKQSKKQMLFELSVIEVYDKSKQGFNSFLVFLNNKR